LVLLEAFALLLERFPSARLRMAGTGLQEQKAITRAKELRLADRCEFLGPFDTHEATSGFTRSLDVFAQHSFADGTPNSIIEAMAHGLQIVASLNGGIPDVVCPTLGILVLPGDSGALAEALARLAADPDLRRRMGRVARQRYEDLFSPAAALPVLLDASRECDGEQPTDERTCPCSECAPTASVGLYWRMTGWTHGTSRALKTRASRN
jgi:glycosyltransferase involved in cell wall biosynthesis